MLNKDTSRTLTDKWNPILEGIEDSSTRESTAVLLENQARAIMNDMAKEGNTLDESTGVGSLGTFQKFAFPLIRRVFPELIANKVCGVQPMQAPVSQVFYLGYTRSGTGGNAGVETVYSRYNLTYAGRDADANAPAGWGTGSGLDQLIEMGGPYDGEGVAANLGISSHTLSPNDTVGGKIAAFPDTTKTYGLNVNQGENLTGTGIPEINFHIEQQAVIARTRKFRALWTLEAAQDLRAYHNLDLERELTDLLGKEVSLEIDRELLEDIRGIAYDWTDNNGWNRDMLSMGNSNNFGDDGTGAFNPSGFYYDLPGDPNDDGQIGTDPAGVRRTAGNVFLVDFASTALGLDPRHVGQVYANLVAVLNFASQDIYKTTYRGAGNWIVTSPMVAAILSSASKLEGGVRQGEFDGQLGANIQYKGKLMGQFDVYVDPLWPEDEIMMGYKGSSPMDSGYIYSPYIPLQMLPTITDPETFQPRKGLLTRYGKTAVSPESRFYRIIRLMGANSNFMTQPFATVKGT